MQFSVINTFSNVDIIACNRREFVGSIPASQGDAIDTPDSILEDRAADFGFDVEIDSSGVILTDGERVEVFATASDAFLFISRLRRQA
jgi:hypothetical protein